VRDPVRLFDQRCKSCSDYDVVLSGSITITANVLIWIVNAIKYNEPINAKLRFVTYNGATIIGPSIDIIGDGTTPSFPINHPLATRDVLVQVIEAFTLYRTADVEIEIETISIVRVTFTVAPPIGENYKVMIRSTTEAYDIIGDDFQTSFAIAHGLNSQLILAQVHEIFDDFDVIDVDIRRTALGTATVVFTTAPATGENYRLVMISNQVTTSIVGDSFQTDFIYVHSLGTRDVFVQVLEGFGNRSEVNVTVERNTVDQITVKFGAAPGVGVIHHIVITT